MIAYATTFVNTKIDKIDIDIRKTFRILACLLVCAGQWPYALNLVAKRIINCRGPKTQTAVSEWPGKSLCLQCSYQCAGFRLDYVDYYLDSQSAL